MTKHTPGPWETQAIDEDGEMRGCITVIGSNLGGLVGAAMPWPTELDANDFARVHANARLIAAAPDMLALIKECRKQINSIIEDGIQTDWSMWRDDIDALISNAESEPPPSRPQGGEPG